VPRSSNKLHEDNEYALYTVVLFRKVSDTFKTAAREKGFQVCFMRLVIYEFVEHATLFI
jgi:hypothetical protein